MFTNLDVPVVHFGYALYLESGYERATDLTNVTKAELVDETGMKPGHAVCAARTKFPAMAWSAKACLRWWVIPRCFIFPGAISKSNNKVLIFNSIFLSVIFKSFVGATPLVSHLKEGY